MSVLIQFCFVQIVGGYVNVAQITRVEGKVVCTIGNAQCSVTGDKIPSDFLDRVKKTCGGKSE